MIMHTSALRFLTMCFIHAHKHLCTLVNWSAYSPHRGTINKSVPYQSRTYFHEQLLAALVPSHAALSAASVPFTSTGLLRFLTGRVAGGPWTQPKDMEKSESPGQSSRR